MINLQQLIFYLKHLTKAKTRHGVHSPFVYRLVDNVIYDIQTKSVYQDIEQLRNKLLQDRRSIKIAKTNAECKVNNKQKLIATIAKCKSRPARLDQLIYRLAAYIKPGNVIESGTCLGISTAYLAKAVPEARIISIQECTDCASIAIENLKKLNIRNVEVLSGNVEVLLPGLIEGIAELDFIVIDRNHTKDAILNYFNWCLPKMSKHSMMVFEDIYRSRKMKSVWKEIKSNPEVSVTIDLFWIGLVFVRKMQAKEDFKIRF